MARKRQKEVFEKNFNIDQRRKALLWYQRIRHSNADFIVLIARRGLVFYQFLEQYAVLEGEDDSDFGYLGEQVIMTDGSFMSLDMYFARFYEEHCQFPTVLLADDILLHGRNIESILSEMLSRIAGRLSKDCFVYDWKALERKFLDCLEICVLGCAQDRITMDTKYLARVSAEKTCTIREIHELSARISGLVIDSDVPNTSYIYSEAVAISREKLQDKRIKKISYMGVVEYFWIFPFIQGDVLQGVAAVKLKEIGKNDDGQDLLICMATPYLLIPDLDENEAEELDAWLEFVMSGHLDSHGLFGAVRERMGWRVHDELIAMVLGQAVLAYFKRCFGAIPSQYGDDFEIYEKKKMSINYYGIFSKEFGACSLSCWRGKVKADTEAGIDVLLGASETLGFNEFLLELHRIVRGKELGRLAIGTNPGLLSDSRLICRELEAFYSDMACRDERRAYQGLAGDQNRVRSMEAFHAFLEFFKVNKKNLQDLIGYFLFMVDFGILSLSFNPARNAKVIGFTQMMKAGEMSLAVFSIRARAYLALVHNMRNECRRRGQLPFFLQKLEKYLSQYCPDKSEGNLFSEYEKKDVLSFARSLEWYGQGAEDWWGSYYNRFIDMRRYIQTSGDRKVDDEVFYNLQMKIARDCIEAF